MSNLSEVIIEPGASIAEALARMDRAGTGALALCTSEGKLAGLLTDGDIRRAILQGIALTEPCGTIATRNPITAREPLSPGEALFLMARRDIAHLPVIDENGLLQRFLLRKDLVDEDVVGDFTRRRLDSAIIAPGLSITQAIARLDEAGTGALALCTPERKLVGLLTDGDIRRAILRGVSQEEPCGGIAVSAPTTAPVSVSAQDALKIMTEGDINHLPIVDDEGRLVDLILRRELVGEGRSSLSAVVMAGGYGTRLLPLTERTPKPMLPIGDRPLLERTIEQLRLSGIRDVSLTTHYLSENIKQHFGDGRGFGVRISYSNEEQPLGTAGGLRLMPRPAGPFLVMNGDILTGMSFQTMLSFHQTYHAAMTVAVRKYDMSVPFGVVECEGVRVARLREKPLMTLFINAGVYLLEPMAYDYIPEGVRYDMTDLISRLLDDGQTVVSFPIIEHWQDVGRPDDYRKAQESISTSTP